MFMARLNGRVRTQFINWILEASLRQRLRIYALLQLPIDAFQDV